MRKWLLLPFLTGVLFVPGSAQQEKTVEKRPGITMLPSANDFVTMAWIDIATVPLYDRPFMRYLTNRDKATMRVSSLATNYISRASQVMRPVPVMNGHLVRVDLRYFAPRLDDLREWISTWDELRFDPMFNTLLTKDTLEFLGEDIQVPKRKRTVVKKVADETRTEERVIKHPGGRYVYPDDSGRFHADLPAGTYRVDLRFGGQTRDVLEVVEEEVKLGKDDVVRINGIHLDQVLLDQLQTVCGTEAPVVDHRYFLTRALTTVRANGVFKTIFGGLYYDFRGIKKAKDVLGKDTKATDLDLYFESLGIGNIKGGVTAAKLFDRLRSDQRSLMLRSEVTGKPRIFEMFHTLAGKEGDSWGAITDDIRDEDIDTGDRGQRNLLTPRIKARESIFPRQNGFPEFALFNGDGALQDVVPPDIAADTTIPNPFTKNLQPGIGCIRCHGPHDGWQPMRNDVKKLMATRKADIFGDFSKRNAFDPDTIDRLFGLYAGSFDKNISRARDDAAEAALKASGPWPESEDQADAYKLGAARVSEVFGEYNFDLVDAHLALREIGIEAPREKSEQVFRKLIPPDNRGNPLGIIGYVPEDPNLPYLAAGIAILRADWALSYSGAAERALRTLRATKPEDISKWLD